MFFLKKRTICNCPTLSLLLVYFLYTRRGFLVLFDLTDFSLEKDRSYILQKNSNGQPFQITTEPNERNFMTTTQQILHEIKASKISNLRCGWSCQAISVTSVTLWPPLRTNSLYEKQTVVFSPHTPCGHVRLMRFTLEDHALGALHLPKTTVLQSTLCLDSFVVILSKQLHRVMRTSLAVNFATSQWNLTTM